MLASALPLCAIRPSRGWESSIPIPLCTNALHDNCSPRYRKAGTSDPVASVRLLRIVQGRALNPSTRETHGLRHA